MDRIAVLLGGDSSERDVSLESGANVAERFRTMGHSVLEIDPVRTGTLDTLLQTLLKDKVDVVFNALHGGSGEDGRIQAALSMTGIRFTGSGYKASCVAMDKYLSKLIAADEGIPVPDYIMVRGDLLNDYQDPSDYQGWINKLGLPVVVKPNDSGSSVGISLVDKPELLKPAVQEAFRHSRSVLLERFIPGRELTVTVLDSEVLPLVEIKPVNGWYDYTNKYTKGRTEYIAPAPIEESEAKLMQVYALRMWNAIGCAGYARVDFRHDGNKAYFLEVNTLPGMTSLSLTPMAAAAAGITFDELLERIIKINS